MLTLLVLALIAGSFVAGAKYGRGAEQALVAVYVKDLALFHREISKISPFAASRLTNLRVRLAKFL